MKTNKNKIITTNDILWIRNYFFSHFTFLSSNTVSVVFNISSAHSNTNLLIGCFSHEQCLNSNYLSILHILLYSESQILRFYIWSSLSSYLILYTKTYINYDSIFALIFMQFHLIYICIYKILTELKILFPLKLH